MTGDTVACGGTHPRIGAERYDSWSAGRCAGIEIVDGTVVVKPGASERHNRLARLLANALDAAAGPDRNRHGRRRPPAGRTAHQPRPDVVVYRAETIDLTPTRPEHVLLVAEVVSPGSETSDRIVTVDQYARAGNPLPLADRTGPPPAYPSPAAAFSIPPPRPTGTARCSPV
ncbi:Uma2 family endonuclease [Streptomyces pactum]|uniref:Uma2 family endonuclease n=1 Tax=Streptomyces pactum TaxID=68249 RepID=UPI0036FD3008